MIQYLNPFEKFCLWALMIAINASVANCQFINFANLEKGLIIEPHRKVDRQIDRQTTNQVEEQTVNRREVK